MYFGNSTGILEYDGVTWRMTGLSIESIVRSLAIDSNGVIYAGGVGDFGYLAPDKRGNNQFVSLISKLKKEDRDFGDVAKIWCTPQGVYFSTFRKLFLFSGGELKTISPTTQFHFSFFVNGNLYVMERGRGITLVSGERVIHVKGSSFLADDRIYSMIPLSETRIILSTREHGLFNFDPTSTDSLNTFTKFENEAEDLLLESQVYHGIASNDTTLAFATLRGGVVFLSEKGKLLNILNKKNALRDDNIKYLYIDRQNGLWMAMDNGIARAEINSPLLYLTDVSGLKGSIQDILRFNNKLYVASTAGVFYSDQAQNSCFTAYPGIAAQARDLIIWQNENKPELLVATVQGIFHLKENGPELIGEYNAFKLYQSRTNPSRVYIGASDGFASILFSGSKWIDEGMPEGINVEINTIAEDKNGDVFLTTRTNWMFRVRAAVDHSKKNIWFAQPEITLLDNSFGLPDNRYNFVFDYKDDFVITTLKGIHRYDRQKQKIVPHEEFKGLVINGNREIFCFQPESQKKIWMSTATDSIKETGVAVWKDGKYEWFSKPFKHFSENEVHVIFPDEKGIVWLGGPDGLIRYDGNNQYEISSDFFPLVRRITVGKDSVYFLGTTSAELKGDVYNVFNEKYGDDPEFSYRNNTIELEFSAPVFDNESKNLFKWYLEGYDKGWTAWSKEQRTSYTNLPEGTYKFRLLAKDIYDNTSNETVFTFTINPPWYRTVYAYIFYILALIGLIYIAVQISVRRLKKAKILLERTVQERTAEVVRQKEEIENQKLIVDQKNKDITDSINYASRIQEAILPLVDDLKAVLPDVFVLFRPRDIVSGDFYWFYQKGRDVLIAAADCTGHGVPGAFMSMIGHTILNDVVAELETPHPDLILNHLNTRIRSALKQDQQNESRDGMDIALCRISLDTRELEYAAAMRPLYLIRDGQLDEVKADKFPIGGLQDGQEKIFTRHNFTLKSGDGFYLSSDGYADQFGGPEGKKFMTKKFKELLQSLFGKPIRQQQDTLLNSFTNWKGEMEQVDDILVIGVRL